MTQSSLDPSPEAVRAVAPGGTLRAAINLGNVVLAQRAADGALEGVAVRLAQLAAGRLGRPLELVPFEAAGRVLDGLQRDAWDLAFLAIDPLRAEQVCFTQPYVVIDSTYLVREDAPCKTVAEVDSPGTRVAASRGSGYELHLRRALRHAELLALPTPEEAFRAFQEGAAEVLAGVRPALLRYSAGQAGLRVLAEPFLAVRHALALPRRAAQALPWLDAFIEQARRTGEVHRALAETGRADAATVPV